MISTNVAITEATGMDKISQKQNMELKKGESVTHSQGLPTLKDLAIFTHREITEGEKARA